MNNRQNRVSVVLAVVALVGVGCLYYASLSVGESFGNLLVGIASSIAAVSFYSLTEAAVRLIARRRLTQFFGSELVKNPTIFVLPDFVVDEKKLAKGVGPGQALKRGSADLREQLIPSATRPLGMGNLSTYSGADIEAALLLATTLGELGNASHRIISDQEVAARQVEGGAMFYPESFISLGFSSNDVTLAYAYDPKRSMISLESFQAESDVEPQLAFRVGGAELYSNTSTTVWGLIIRYGGSDQSDRRFFICGGLSSKGTTAAARYLARQWEELARRVPKGDFAAVIAEERDGAGEPRLVRIHSK